MKPGQDFTIEERDDEDANPAEAPQRPAGGKGHFTQVDNAHASGVGAMGRNDEKLPTGSDNSPAPPEPAY